MGNYHGYKCKKCSKELDLVGNEDNQVREDEDENIETWKAIFACPDGHGELIQVIEEHSWYDVFEDEEMTSQEVVHSKWIELV